MRRLQSGDSDAPTAAQDDMKDIAAEAAGRAAGVAVAVATGVNRDQRAVQLPAPGGEREAEDAGGGGDSSVEDHAMCGVDHVEARHQRRGGAAGTQDRQAVIGI